MNKVGKQGTARHIMARREKKVSDGFFVVLVSCPAEAAERIATTVLAQRLAGCVNILPEVRSLYWWKGKLGEASERLLLVKTRKSLLSKLERAVREVHPYEVPEIIALPIERGYRPYLDWIRESTEKVPTVRGSSPSWDGAVNK